MNGGGRAKRPGSSGQASQGREPAPAEALAAAEHPATAEEAAPAAGPAGEDRLPLLPGFREMAQRRMSAQRQRLIADLAGQRQAAGLSQTEVAARMGTSQSAVARLEAGEADLRLSTLERYAAAIGSQLTWQLRGGPASGGGAFRADSGRNEAARPGDPGRLSHPGGGSHP